MNRIALVAAAVFGLLAPNLTAEEAQPPMPSPKVSTNNYYLERFLREMTTTYEGEQGYWSFELYDVPMMVLSDESNDRIRILAPIRAAAGLERAELRQLMEANFDRTLDAKYAIWRETLWATYVHPLSHINKEEFKDAVRQVAHLHSAYGSTDPIMGLGYGADEGDED